MLSSYLKRIRLSLAQTWSAVQTFASGIHLSGNSNLDYYGEGTWTPVLSGSGSNPTQTAGTTGGSWRRVGAIVTVDGYFSGVSFSGGAGNASIGNLPFAPNGGLYGAGSASFQTAFPADRLGIAGGTVYLIKSNGSIMQISEAGPGGYAYFSFTYRV